MGWMLAVMLLVVGALTGDLVLAVQLIVIFTVGVQVVKWGDKQVAKDVAKMKVKEAATEKRMRAAGINKLG